jgi:hypothetical protein
VPAFVTDGAQLRDGVDTQAVEDFLCLTSKAAKIGAGMGAGIGPVR